MTEKKWQFCLFFRDVQSRDDLVILKRKFELQRGDVVVLEDPKKKYNTLIKRVVALQGKYVFLFYYQF